MTLGEYEITSAAPGVCDFCGEPATGRVMVELYGGSLWVCQHCYDLLKANRHKPYSKAMDRYSVLACGYHISRKMARMRRPVCTA
jgi:ribosomal protein L37AE/L43A